MSYIDDLHNSNPGLSGGLNLFSITYSKFFVQYHTAMFYRYLLVSINSSTLAPHRSSGSEAINIGIKLKFKTIYACLNRSAAPPYFTIKITTPLVEIKFETFYVSRVATPI